MSLTRAVAAVAVLIASVAPASAQGARKLEIAFDNGKVTLVAENVTVREILNEWARKGGSKIVNAEKLSGSPVYLTEFKGEPEAVVLRTLLREAPGYGVALRTDAASGASTIGTLLILASRSVPVSNAAVAAPQVSTQPPPQPQAAPRLIQGSPDDEIPPARPVSGAMPPPATAGAPPANNPNLRTGQGGIVTSTIPGVTIPAPANPGRGGGPGTAGGPPLPPGRGGGGGGS